MCNQSQNSANVTEIGMYWWINIYTIQIQLNINTTWNWLQNVGAKTSQLSAGSGLSVEDQAISWKLSFMFCDWVCEVTPKTHDQSHCLESHIFFWSLLCAGNMWVPFADSGQSNTDSDCGFSEYSFLFLCLARCSRERRLRTVRITGKTESAKRMRLNVRSPPNSIEADNKWFTFTTSCACVQTGWQMWGKTWGVKILWKEVFSDSVLCMAFEKQTLVRAQYFQS